MVTRISKYLIPVCASLAGFTHFDVRLATLTHTHNNVGTVKACAHTYKLVPRMQVSFMITLVNRGESRGNPYNIL